MGRKKQKGHVTLSDDRGRIRLRWSHRGKRYSINLAAIGELGNLAAKELAVQIEKDLVLGHFDPTLTKYTGHGRRVPNLPVKFVELFEYWVSNYKQMDCNQHTNYFSTRSMILKWGKVDSKNIVDKLNGISNSAVTFNRRLTILKSFVTWLVENSIWERNPLSSVERKKIKRTQQPKRDPFTEDEIKRILHAFKTNAACSKYTSTKHDHYYPFLYFLFKTGVRNAEAIGLRVKHVDTTRKLIHIKEVLARTMKSTTSKNRIRKSTKNEKERMLPLTSDLESILSPLLVDKHPEDLVFLSPTKRAIDDNNFQDRIFKKVLHHLGISERVLYAIRHTFGSRCIDQGITPVMTAFLMGNNPETALRRYTHQLNIPSNLPGI